MPDTITPVQRKILSLPEEYLRSNVSFVQDYTVNILGFIPVGFFFSAYLVKATRKRKAVAYLIVLLLGVGLSLLIELAQAWLPMRYSSLVDVACNAAGTVLGIAAFRLFAAKGGLLQERREG